MTRVGKWCWEVTRTDGGGGEGDGEGERGRGGDVVYLNKQGPCQRFPSA